MHSDTIIGEKLNYFGSSFSAVHYNYMETQILNIFFVATEEEPVSCLTSPHLDLLLCKMGGIMAPPCSAVMMINEDCLAQLNNKMLSTAPGMWEVLNKC